MITYVNGDLFTSPARVLVNTVNTVGVMGKGIAKEFKRNFPEMFKEYQELCERGDFEPGALFFYRAPHKSVLNFPTKRHWRSPSRVEYIEQGLQTFVDSYEQLGIDSIAFPQLGCGNGDLNWERQVRPVMEQYLKQLPIRVYVHIAESMTTIPEHRNPAWMKEWLNSEPESLPVSEVWNDLVQAVTMNSRIGHWRIGTQITQVMAPWADEHSDEGVDEEVLLFRSGLTEISMSREEFSPIWRKLSTLGLISANDFPSDIQSLNVPLSDLLLTLDYLEPVEFVAPKKSGEELESGIMLIPRRSTQQLQMDLSLVEV